MPTTINTPDGPRNFPDGMSMDDIAAVMKKQFPPKAQTPPDRSVWDKLGHGAATLIPHAVQAWHDATVTAPDALVNLATNPQARAAAEKAIQQQLQNAKDTVGGYVQQVRNLSPQQFRGSAPAATPQQLALARNMESNVTQATGVNPTPQRLSKALGGNLGQPNANLARTALNSWDQHPLGTAMALAPALGKAAGVVGDVADATGLTEAIGPAGQKVADALGKMGPTPIPDAPTVDALKAQSGALYEAAKQQGVVVKAPVFQKFATGLAAKAEDAGIDPTLTSKATAALSRITSTEGDVDLGQLDRLRRIASMATASPVKDDRRIGFILKDGLDSFVGDLGPKDVLSGDVGAASDMLTQARDLWGRGARGQAIEDMIAKAKANPSGSLGYDTALRAQFRKFANNSRAMAPFSADEQAAIQKVASGGPVSDVLYAFGGFAPTSWAKAGADSMMGMLAERAGHPAMAASALAASIPAKIGSTALTARRARMASALARTGGNQ